MSSAHTEAASRGTGEVGVGNRARGQAHQEAAVAMQRAARWLPVEPSALRATDYRSCRARQDGPILPSALRISVLFAGWQRAREQLATLTRDEVAVEAQVVRALYGDPVCRRDAYGTAPGPLIGR